MADRLTEGRKPRMPDADSSPARDDRSAAEAGEKKTEAEGETPVIGRPRPPPPALTVAISGRLAAPVRLARRRQFVMNAVGIAILAGVVVALAIAVDRFAGLGRLTALAEAFAVGGLLAVGAVLRRRPLELGAGVLARGPKGGLALWTSCVGVFLFVSSLFREAAEGAVYGLGLVRSDPAAELASWIVLALAKPHGPGPGAWVSLEGVNAAGLFGFPEDLKIALAALRPRGWVEVDATRYPPLVRLPEGAGDPLGELAG